MNSASASQSRTIQVPPAFLCTISEKVMKDPVMGLCGHLFDRSRIHQTAVCPKDSYTLTINNSIPFPELKQKIQSWEKQHSTLSSRTHAAVFDPYGATGPKRSDNPLGSKIKENSGQTSFQGEGLKPESTSPQEEDADTYLAEIMARAGIGSVSWSCSRRVTKAHNDDIHGMILKNAGQFYTGSKDGQVREWNNNGQLIKALDVGLTRTDYRHWVTALGQMPSGELITGFRDGYIHVYNRNGRFQRSFRNSPKGASHISKQRNHTRINCVRPISEEIFCTGVPEYVQIWHVNNGFLSRFKVRDNDWVYCIEPVRHQSIAVVAGSALEIFELHKETYSHKHSLIEEEKSTRSGQGRPHIASVVAIDTEKTKLATASFDGSIQIVDVNRPSNAVSTRWNEHNGRAWCVVQVDENTLASGADDRLVKIWDIRSESSAITLGPHCGRTSALLKVGDTRVVVGACPSNPHVSVDKAVLTFWDLRKGD